ncbi:hypothetical protein QVD17_12845 [Tagetes erecta]|uniref:Uncharacterized protein n=1 Tax=Tagetes erecta TaxID=13708 RepID=A0AAD8KWC9_TARER|nr:hypothetical protein QVD17_12845 [Tagetes erecta]
MNKSIHVNHQQPFTAPEIDAALQLIQLSSDSAYEVLATVNRKRRKEICEIERSSGSSDIRPTTPLFIEERRKRKKFRSVFEIYEITSFQV